MYEVAHVGVVVKDIDASGKFYSQVLDCEIDERIETNEMTLLMLKSGNQTLELIRYKNNNSNPISRGAGVIDHIAFFVPDMDAAVERLLKFNVSLLDKPKKLPDKIILFFGGPDNERLEFIQLLS
ncbi:hypothetical protein SDC9_06016 [bioreactor metagenome]|uniref:VOC domain-containing protein n=1 Tax=bioreactor metagenome TaxID=1076179 RepID=A0A644T0M6_9ZZZZ|nr:VOC family protein [Negativicutes bacterium]